MPGALQEGSKMEGGGGDNCHAIFKVSSSGMTLSAQDFPSPPSPSPVFRGLCFSTSWTLPWAFWGQILELSFPSPPLQKARWLQAWEYLKSLPSAPEMPPLGNGLYEHKSELGAGWHGPSLPWQPNHPSLADCLYTDRERFNGPPPLLQTLMF